MERHKFPYPVSIQYLQQHPFLNFSFIVRWNIIALFEVVRILSILLSLHTFFII
jgi:hypothetical protein